MGIEAAHTAALAQDRVHTVTLADAGRPRVVYMVKLPTREEFLQREFMRKFIATEQTKERRANGGIR
jgi:hypothetical protein